MMKRVCCIGLLIAISCSYFPLGIDGSLTCEAKSQPDVGQNLTCDSEDCSTNMMNNSKHQIPANLTYFSAENTYFWGDPALQIQMEVQLRTDEAERNYLKVQMYLNSPGNSTCKRIILKYPSLSQSLNINLKIVWGPVAEETIFNISTGIISRDENLLTKSVETGKRERKAVHPGLWTTKITVSVIQIGNLFRVECEFFPAPAEFPIHQYRISLCEVLDARHYPSCPQNIITNETDMNVIVFETTRVGNFTVKVSPSPKGQLCPCGEKYNLCYACTSSYSDIFSLVKSDSKPKTFNNPASDISKNEKNPSTSTNRLNKKLIGMTLENIKAYSSLEPLNSHMESSTVYYDQGQVTPKRLPPSSNSFPLYFILPQIFGIVVPAFGIVLYFSICRKQKLKHRKKNADEKRSKQRCESIATGAKCHSFQECTTKSLCLIYAEDDTKHTSVISHFAKVLIRYFRCEVTCCPWQKVLAGHREELPIHTADFIVLINSKTAYDFYITLQKRKDDQDKDIRKYLQGEDVFLERLQRQTKGRKFVPKNVVSLTFAYTPPCDQIKDGAIIHDFEYFRDFSAFISHIHKVELSIIEEYLKRVDVTLEIEKIKSLVEETTSKMMSSTMSHVEGNKTKFGNNVYGTSTFLEKPSVQETTEHEVTKHLGNFIINVNECQSLFEKIDSVSEVVLSSPYTDRSSIAKTHDYTLNEHCAADSQCAKPFPGDLEISFYSPMGSVSGDISSAQQAEAMVDINKKYNIDLKTHFMTQQKHETFENDGNQNGNNMEEVQCGKNCRNNQIVQTTNPNEHCLVTGSHDRRQSNLADIFIPEERVQQNTLNRSDEGAVHKDESNSAIFRALTVLAAEHEGEKKLQDNFETQTIFRISV